MWTRICNDRVTLLTRLLIIIVNLIAVIFLSIGVNAAYYFDTDGFGTFVQGITLLPVCFSLVWTGIALGLYAGKVKYHPGVDLGLECVAGGMAIGIIWIMIDWITSVGSYRNNGCLHWASPGSCSDSKADLLNACQIIAVVTVLVSFLCHFFLFVKACRETHVRRLEGKKKRQSFVELKESNKAGADASKV